MVHQDHATEAMLLPSFLCLFEQHKGMLYAIALRLLGYGEDAKDAVQETFIKAYINLHTLKDKNAFAGWLKTIVYNHCLAELRHRKKEENALKMYAKNAEVIEAMHLADNAPESIKSTLAGLPEILQLTAMLRFFSKNSSYSQIAQILDIPVGTVRSRLAESRAKLSQLLTKYSYEKTMKAKEMECFYQYHMENMYDDNKARSGFLNHFDTQVSFSVTSGKVIKGPGYMQALVEFDMSNGVRTMLTEVNSSGNVSILELASINPPDKPDICPLTGTFIVVHPKTKAEKVFLHNVGIPQAE